MLKSQGYVVVVVSPCFWQIFQAIAFPIRRAAAGEHVNGAAGDGSSAAGDVIIVGTAVLAVLGIIIVGIIIIAVISIIVAVIIIIAVIIDAGAPARRREEGHCKVCARDA